MNQLIRHALMATLCLMFCSARAQQAQLVSALIDGCAASNDGADEWVMLYSGGSTFTAGASTIDISYGTSSPATTGFTSSFRATDATTNTFVSGLNTLLGTCNFSFINAEPGTTSIPSGSHILIFNDDVLTNGTANIDYDAWCASFQSGSNIYVLFSTDANWTTTDFFENAPSGTIHFRSVVNSNTVDLNYTDNWATGAGNYVTWSDGGGAGVIFSNYTGCQPTNTDALPVTLIDFTASSMQDHVSINWTTAEESGNSHFTLYKSNDYMQWEEVALIPGKGTTSEIQHYEYRDYSPLSGRSYYKLRQTDFNGQFEVFEVISVIFDPSGIALKVFPNPSSDYITVDCSQRVDCLSLINNQGQVFRLDNLSTGTLKARFDIRHLPKGVYRVLVHGTSNLFKEKLVKLN